MQINREEIVFKNGIPKKNYFILSILFSKFLILIPFFKFVVKKYLKNCKNIYIIPGFRFFYGNIYAENCALSDTFFLDYAPVYIGEGSKFSFENMVITATHVLNNFDIVRAKPVVIGKNVWVTTRCIILAGVTIGDNSVIGAGSVVSRDIPANCFAAGNPCVVVKYFDKKSSA